MAFTQPTISHTFQNADGTAASGSIEFTLGGRMQNGTISLVPSSITSNLNGSGALSQALYSNLDPSTLPAYPNNVQWRVDIRILGADTETYFISVPPIQTETSGSTTNLSEIVQLSSLTAQVWMVGQSISGTGIPSGATITSVNTTANQVTISANATATGSGLTLTLGSTIDLGQLLPNTAQV